MACAPAPVSKVDMEPRDFECSVCSEMFTSPKVLPCGHVLCHTCVLKLLKQNKDAKCPLCRVVIIKPSDLATKSIEDVVSGFPTDKSMEVLIEAERILSKDHQCCICDTVLATSMCMECKDMFCPSCKKAHGKQSVSKNHVVEDLSSLTVETLAAKYSSDCSSHPGEVPKLFCPNHGTSICYLCASYQHRKCNDIKDMAEKMEESRITLENLITRLTEGETKLDKAIDELLQHQQNMEKDLDAAVIKVETMFDQLDAAVKKNRQRMKDLIEKARITIRDTVNEGKTYLLQRKTKLTTHKQVVERAEHVENEQAVTSISGKMEPRVNNLEFSTALPKDATAVCGVKFLLDPAAVTGIKQQLAGLGEVKLEPADLTINEELTGFCFHNNHRKDVTLSNNSRTATKSQDVWNGIVMSRYPLQINTLYEVKIDKFDSNRISLLGDLCVGVVGNLTQAIVVSWQGVKPINGDWDKKNKVGSALGTLKTNSRAGVSLDSARCLHVYVDGKDQGVADRNIPDPCYAMFHVRDKIVQITALPLTRLSR